MPGPDPNMLALEPDGKILLINDQTQVVHLDKGSDDRVYQGLTFTVYDRGSSIPKDGKGKAEVEVFDVADNYSAARIIKSELNRPILQHDIVANLIWDTDRTNLFVIAGEFDIDKDKRIDVGGADRARSRPWIRRIGRRQIAEASHSSSDGRTGSPIHSLLPC